MIKKIIKMMILMMGGIYYLNAQSYQPYTVSDSHWVMGRHDIKRTGFNPVRCQSPANVSRTWFHPTAGSDGNEVNTIIPPRRVFSSGNALSFTDNNLNLAMYNAYNGSIIWYRSSPDDADYEESGCVYAYNNLVFCQWINEASDPWSDEESKAQLYDANNGNILWTNQDASSEVHYPSPAVYQIGSEHWIFRGVNGNARAAKIMPTNPYYQQVWSVNLGFRVEAPAILKTDGLNNYVLYPVSNFNNNSLRDKVVALNISNGTIKWSWDLPPGKRFNISAGRPYESAHISGYDIDNDGKDEIFVRYDSFLVMLKEINNSPTLVWSRKLPSILYTAIAIGPILPNNKIGIAVIPFRIGSNPMFCSNKLIILDATNGNILWTINLPEDYCNSPTIADVNADGIYDVIIASLSCSNPVAYSSSNNFSSPVWQSTGCSQAAPLSSDIAVGLIDTVMAFSIGDESCYTNVWLCKKAITPVSFNENWRINYKVIKGGIQFEGYGNVEIYKIDGSLIGNYEVNGFRKILLLKGVYMVRINKENKKVIIN